MVDKNQIRIESDQGTGMEKIEATYRIVTPMFIGGADQTPDDGIRPPSLKGALRFWWRALNWGKYRSATGATDDSALKVLHDKEGKLFGLAADSNGGGGQGCFLLSVQSKQFIQTEAPKVHDSFRTKPAARYLGYGLIVAYRSQNQNPPTKSGQLTRSCINENQTFTVTLTFRDKIEDSIVVVLKVLGLLGGLGSRLRHGMGSIALESLKVDDQDKWACPSTAEQYDEAVKGLFLSANGDVKPASVTTDPPFTAFWKESRIDRLLVANSCYQVLDNFGNAMLDYRSWGQSSRGNKLPSGKVSEKRFEDDHHWYKPPNGWAALADFHPERIAFGLPHNYNKNHHHVISENHERRSSPLFFHVHRLSSNSFIGVSIYMPAKFLPDGEKIKANGKRVENKVNKGKAGKVIVGFLDGKVGDTASSPKPSAPLRFKKTSVLP